MSCPHVETTAVLAAFGEAPEAFWQHHSGCAACQATVSAHKETWGLVQSAVAAPGPSPVPVVSSKRWYGAVAGFVVAAGLLVSLQAVPEAPKGAAQTAMPGDMLDVELSMIEWELALMDFGN